MELVNGYVCRDCTDVGYAKKFIDPAHPKEGPHGRDARESEKAGQDRGPAVLFAGAAGQPQGTNGVERVPESPFVPGASVDFKV